MATSVSVVIPARPEEPYLAEGIGSVVAQRPAPAEVIVVAQGERSADAAGRFGLPVRVLEHEPANAGAVRNAGIDGASGDVVGFLDADDLLPPGSLAVRADVLGAEPAPDIVWGRVSHFLSPDLDPSLAARLHVPEGSQPAHLVGGLLVRREVFDRVGGFDPNLRLGELVDWVARARDAGLTERDVDAVVLERRIHGGNYTLTHRESLADTVRAMKGILDRRRAAARER